MTGATRAGRRRQRRPPPPRGPFTPPRAARVSKWEGRMKHLKPHKFAELLPFGSDAEFGALLDDIDAHGQREPIDLFEGQILDGRRRYAAMRKLKRKPITRKFNGSELDAVRFVYSKAVHRNMNDTQKACSALKFLP